MVKQISAMLLVCVLAVSVGCTGQDAQPPASGSPSPVAAASASGTPAPTSAATLEPLPDIGTLAAKYDAARGMVITWAPFVTDYSCTLERRDGEDEEYEAISRVDAQKGQFTDPAPGFSGTELVYRLRVSDGSRAAYSQEAKITIPFDFGNTGGNLQNGGLACEKDGIIYRLGIEDDEIGIYAVAPDGNTTLLVKGIASQINVSGGFLYYIKQATGELFRIPLTGGEPSLVCGEKMVFALVSGSAIYGTLDEGDTLAVMNTDGSGMETLAEGCFDLGADGQTLYYTNTETGEFVMRSLVTGETQFFALSKRGFAQLFDGRVYYQDESNGKKLTSCAADGSDATVLLDQPVSGVNVAAGGVYCVNRSDGSAPYLVSFDGSDKQRLASAAGDYINTMGEDLLLINAAGKFYQIGEDGSVIVLYG